MSKRPFSTRLPQAFPLAALLVLCPLALGDQAAPRPATATSPGEPAAETPKTMQAAAPRAGGETPKTTIIPLATGVLETRVETPGQAQPAAEMPPDEAELRARVKARWDALLKRDYDALYEFATPSYRQVFDKRHFLGNFGQQLRRDGVEVTRVTFNNPERTSAQVLVAILYTTEVAGKITQLRGASRGNWVKVEGEWYNVPNR